MQVDDFERFRAVMTGMAEVFQRELSAPLLDAYWLSLREWELTEFEAAAAELMRTSEHMPRPAAFMGLKRRGRATPGEAWAEALAYARRGYNPNFPRLPQRGLLTDPVVARAIDAIGGYQALAASSPESTQFLERRFAEHFESIQESSDVREAVPELMHDKPRNLTGPVAVGGLLERIGKS
jgi:hypothetical protein